jgi:hypothetical protein
LVQVLSLFVNFGQRQGGGCWGNPASYWGNNSEEGNFGGHRRRILPKRRRRRRRRRRIEAVEEVKDSKKQTGL